MAEARGSHPHPLCTNLPHTHPTNPTGPCSFEMRTLAPTGASCGKLCPFWSSCRKAVTWKVQLRYSPEVARNSSMLPPRGSGWTLETLNHETATNLQPHADTSNKLLRLRHAR